MLRLILVLLSIVACTSLAGEFGDSVSPEKGECKDCPADDNAARMKELKALGAGDTDVKINEFVVEPRSRSCSSVTYEFDKERVLKPGEALYFSVPKELRGQSANLLLVGHRQDVNDGNNREYEKIKANNPRARDDSPGLTSVQLHMIDKPKANAWRHYLDLFGGSGKNGAKFAELDSKPENEGLEGFRSHGHRGVHSGDVTKDKLLIDAIRLVSVGKDPVHVKYLTMKASLDGDTIEKIFTPGTKFDDPATGEAAVYGGGEHHGGKYPKAVVLNGTNESLDLPAGWKLSRNELRIPLPAGRKFMGVELAIGDLHPDGKPNRDGGVGTAGWARLSTFVKKADGSREYMTRDENIGKNGTMLGYPQNCDYVATAGDELVLNVNRDAAYLMGLRMHFKKP